MEWGILLSSGEEAKELWVFMFPMKWRAKEPLRVSQPHTSLFSDKSMWNQLILKLYRLSKGEHKTVHQKWGMFLVSVSHLALDRTLGWGNQWLSYFHCTTTTKHMVRDVVFSFWSTRLMEIACPLWPSGHWLAASNSFKRLPNVESFSLYNIIYIYIYLFICLIRIYK